MLPDPVDRRDPRLHLRIRSGNRSLVRGSVDVVEAVLADAEW